MNDFTLQFDLDCFEKADAPEGRKRRIGGIASIETTDRQKEILLQRGLDFSEFVNNGWFNDNHSKATGDVLGYPEGAFYFEKGEILPNGKLAIAPGHWVEGYLLNTKKADEIWDLATALKNTPRRLGFSVEGNIRKRDAIDKSIVAQAVVREVAITKSPVNTNATMDVLVKSLSMGESIPGIAPVGLRTGEGAGQVLSCESLEGVTKITDYKKKKKKKVRKGLNDSEAFVYLANRVIGLKPREIGQLIELTRKLKKTGKL